MFGGDSSDVQWCSECRVEHERWVMQCRIVDRSTPAGGRRSPHDAVEVDVSDMDLHRWALLDMLLEGSGIRYVLDGPMLGVAADRSDDAISIVEAVRLHPS